jgi:glycosyltransferase involved in cell wall biosynthesis
MISVIIPAHNESVVLGRTLDTMLADQQPGELDVIVVCNGCTDETAEIARRFGPTVRVIETDIASKVAALNLGDRAACGFPRIYVDADISLSINDLRSLASELASGRVLAVAPHPTFDLCGCSWPVRAYYAIHSMLPASSEGIGGSGVYALSELGRDRFDEFPNLVADDGFVRLQFVPSERRTLRECQSVVRAPRTLHDLLAIKTRSQFGSFQLRRRYPYLWRANIGASNGAALKRICFTPWLWPRLAVYILVKVIVRRRARKRLHTEAVIAWDRDDTSRRSLGTTGPQLHVSPQ